jgi:acyl-coenzyme A thioesterase PaaI-like protein
VADLLALLEEARRTGDMGPVAQAVPCARFIGLTAVHDGQGVVSRLDFAPHIVGNPMLPALHGGALGALVESAAVFELLWSTPIPRVPKTISLTVEYLRSAKPVTTWARGDITHHGRRVATVRVLAWQDEVARPVVAANAHFLLAEDR